MLTGKFVPYEDILCVRQATYKEEWKESISESWNLELFDNSSSFVFGIMQGFIKTFKSQSPVGL